MMEEGLAGLFMYGNEGSNAQGLCSLLRSLFQLKEPR